MPARKTRHAAERVFISELPTVGDAAWVRWLAGVDGGVVDDEGCLEFEVLASGELERDLLPGVGAQREGVLGVTGEVVEVGVRVQGGQHRSRAVEYLNFESVEHGGRGGLSRVDVQPEAEVVGGAPGRQRDRLRQGVGVGGAVAVEPGVPGTAARRFLGVVADHAGTGRPWGCRPGLETGVAEQLHWRATWRGRGGAGFVALRTLTDRVHGRDLVEIGL